VRTRRGDYLSAPRHRAVSSGDCVVVPPHGGRFRHTFPRCPLPLMRSVEGEEHCLHAMLRPTSNNRIGRATGLPPFAYTVAHVERGPPPFWDDGRQSAPSRPSIRRPYGRGAGLASTSMHHTPSNHTTQPQSAHHMPTLGLASDRSCPIARACSLLPNPSTMIVTDAAAVAARGPSLPPAPTWTASVPARAAARASTRSLSSSTGAARSTRALTRRAATSLRRPSLRTLRAAQSGHREPLRVPPSRPPPRRSTRRRSARS